MSEYSAPVNFIDLSAQQSNIRVEIDLAIKKVLDHGQYIMGPEVKEFEGMLKSYTGASYALTCANGTDALTLAMMSWGIAKGDAVFVPSFTYVASAETPAQLGATPFFVDVLEDTFNISHESFKQAIIDAKKMGLKPSVVIVVDLFGQPAEVDTISEIAKNNGIKVLVDAAQSFGATYKNRNIGVIGDVTTTSFFPAKPLGCYGDGGAIFTNNEELSYIINSIRLHGKGAEKYDNVRVGINSRLDTIQAAVLIEKLKIFPNEIIERNRVADRYNDGLHPLDNVITPEVLKNVTSVWAQYTLKVKNRAMLQSSLREANIPSVVYYPKSLTQQSGYKNYPIVSSGVGISDKLPQIALSLPMHPYLTSSTIDKIIEVISKSN